MIRRFVFFRFKEAYRGVDAKAEILERTHEVLQTVPGVLDYEVGTPADEKASAAWDLSISVGFETRESLAAYIADPEHRRYVDEFIKPRLEVIKAWNFHPSGSESVREDRGGG